MIYLHLMQLEFSIALTSSPNMLYWDTSNNRNNNWQQQKQQHQRRPRRRRAMLCLIIIQMESKHSQDRSAFNLQKLAIHFSLALFLSHTHTLTRSPSFSLYRFHSIFFKILAVRYKWFSNEWLYDFVVVGVGVVVFSHLKNQSIIMICSSEID